MLSSNIRSHLLSPMARRSIIANPQSTSIAATTIQSTTTTAQSLQTTAPFSTKSKKKTLQSYNDEKQSKKQYRTDLYHKSQERTANLPNRRKGKGTSNNKNFQKNAFRKWFDEKRNLELYLNRVAKRQNQQWKIKLGLMIERLPVVTEEDEDWELDYMYMKAHYDRERSIVYPKEILGFGDPMEDEILTKEELIESLPEGFKPAPRITEEDKNNIIQSLNRKLSQRVYLAIRPDDKSGWSLPITDLDGTKEETFVDGVKRFIQSNKMLQDLEIRCLSNCPMVVDTLKYDEEDKGLTENGAYFGEKVFYMRVQYEDGSVDEKKVDKSKMSDWGWLGRSEMADRVKAERGEEESLFYHYML